MLVRRKDYNQSARAIWRAYSGKCGHDCINRLVHYLDAWEHVPHELPARRYDRRALTKEERAAILEQYDADPTIYLDGRKPSLSSICKFLLREGMNVKTVRVCAPIADSSLTPPNSAAAAGPVRSE